MQETWRDRRGLWALLAICGSLYLTALPGILFWDNELLILKNVYLRSWRFIPKILTTSLFAGAGEVTNYYRPVPMMLLLAQYQAWGAAPLGYHAASIALHLAAIASLYWFARRVLGSGSGALLAAAIFALHPVQNETINYVDHQEGILALIFGLCAILARERGRLAASLACWTLCLLSKEEGVTLFLCMACYKLGRGDAPGGWSLQWGPGRSPEAASRDLARRLFGLWPYAALLGVYLLARLTILNFLHLPALDFGAQKGAYAGAGLRLLTFAKALITYFRLLLWPTGLHFDRGMAPVASILDISAWASAAAGAAAIAGLWTLSPGPGRFGILWFLAAMLPFCGLVPFNNILGEHFLYIPLAGLSITFAAVWSRWRPAPGTRQDTACRTGAILLAVFWLAQDVRRNRDWQDPVRLYFSTLAGNPKSYRAANNLGVEYFRQGTLEKARGAFEMSLAVRHDYAPALNNVGAVLENQGHPAEALQFYRRSLAADSAYVPALKNMAGLLMRQGRFPEAAAAAQDALKLHPDYPEVLDLLAMASIRTKDHRKAKEALERAVEISPSPSRFATLAEVYRILGESRKAAETRRLAVAKP